MRAAAQFVFEKWTKSFKWANIPALKLKDEGFSNLLFCSEARKRLNHGVSLKSINTQNPMKFCSKLME